MTRSLPSQGNISFNMGNATIESDQADNRDSQVHGNKGDGQTINMPANDQTDKLPAPSPEIVNSREAGAGEEAPDFDPAIDRESGSRVSPEKYLASSLSTRNGAGQQTRSRDFAQRHNQAHKNLNLDISSRPSEPRSGQDKHVGNTRPTMSAYHSYGRDLEQAYYSSGAAPSAGRTSQYRQSAGTKAYDARHPGFFHPLFHGTTYSHSGPSEIMYPASMPFGDSYMSHQPSQWSGRDLNSIVPPQQQQYAPVDIMRYHGYPGWERTCWQQEPTNRVGPSSVESSGSNNGSWKRMRGSSVEALSGNQRNQHQSGLVGLNKVNKKRKHGYRKTTSKDSLFIAEEDMKPNHSPAPFDGNNRIWNEDDAADISMELVSSRKIPVELDRSNILIYKLRTMGRHHWSYIVDYMNEHCPPEGSKSQWTQAAVYGRFTRNGPRVAAARGDSDFDTKNYMHLRTDEHDRTRGSQRAGRVSGSSIAECAEQENEEECKRESHGFSFKDDITFGQVMEKAIDDANLWPSVTANMTRMLGRPVQTRDIIHRLRMM